MKRNGPNNLEYYITLGWQVLPVTYTLAYWTHSEATKKQGPYSQHFIFIVTDLGAQQARIFHQTKLQRNAGDKHLSLVTPFLSC